jgi:hypothetical protein
MFQCTVNEYSDIGHEKENCCKVSSYIFIDQGSMCTIIIRLSFPVIGHTAFAFRPCLFDSK